MFLFFCSLLFTNMRLKVQVGLKPMSNEVDAWNWPLISSRPLCLILALLLIRQVSGYEHSRIRCINTLMQLIYTWLHQAGRLAWNQNFFMPLRTIRGCHRGIIPLPNNNKKMRGGCLGLSSWKTWWNPYPDHTITLTIVWPCVGPEELHLQLGKCYCISFCT